jgi:hypothetical protein
MALFTRKDYELLAAMVEDIRHESRVALLERRKNGFEHRKTDQECDGLLESLKGKLAATRMILADKEAMKKSPAFAFVIKRKTKPWLFRRAAVNFRELAWTMHVDEEEAEDRLNEESKRDRYTIIWLSGRGAKKPTEQDLALKEAAEAEMLELKEHEWKRTTILDARAKSLEGVWLDKTHKDGRVEKIFSARYMVRFVGEGDSAYAEYVELFTLRAAANEGGETIEPTQESSVNPPSPPLKAMAKGAGA